MNGSAILAGAAPEVVPEGGARAAHRVPARRLLGRLGGHRPGPTLVVVGGLHGNEPSGFIGAQRVLAALAGREHEVRGDIVVLVGNLAALKLRQRFVARDLNRAWSEPLLAALRATEPGPGEVPEDGEQRELIAALDDAFAAARGEVYILDLHSTSGFGPPFGLIADTLRSRAIALRLPVPIVLGLEEELDGTMASYLGDKGYVTIGFETGQHDDPDSVGNAEAAVWGILYATGLIESGDARQAEMYERLQRATRGLPRVVEIRHRHGVVESDGFRMRDGYRNFQPVAAGEHLADDRNGEVRAPESGAILMPLYQKQGDDGYFLVRRFSPFWLRVSSALRRLGVDRVVHWLPGVDRGAAAGTYAINRHVARWFALEIFHLLGFRRHGARDDRLTVSRRPHDVHADRNHNGG